ncbi:unnamed protein product [Oncorhynchus mykiss]|uniref:Uncharacterized protein n=1 Tax=Oncorhynchus mykiss TaxID=8022 RepID=A0A060YPU0_ONCMY|nr:unnamed protein product [Oncorhynchus mykiss]
MSTPTEHAGGMSQPHPGPSPCPGRSPGPGPSPSSGPPSGPPSLQGQGAGDYLQDTMLPMHQPMEGVDEKGMGDETNYGQMKGVGMRALHSGMGPSQSPLDQHINQGNTATKHSTANTVM